MYQIHIRRYEPTLCASRRRALAQGRALAREGYTVSVWDLGTSQRLFYGEGQ